MNFKDIKQVYFLGIGGIGMSAIARYFYTQNIPVMGYDKTETELTKALVNEGIKVHYKDMGSELANFGFDKKNVLVVLTPAIPKKFAVSALLRNAGPVAVDTSLHLILNLFELYKLFISIN
jgi:UDP-N-acetylmuramate--alanine ligase